MKKLVLTLFPYLILVLTILLPSRTIAQSGLIQNDSFWSTTDGKPINSQGGGIFKFEDPTSGKTKFYWYGVHYVEADTYRNNPSVTLKGTNFEAVTCYSSTDLVNWKFESNVLTKADLNQRGKTWVGRLGVAYIKALKKYALFVQHGSGVLIALANSPTGQFIWDQKLDMTSLIGTSNTGDQTVFTDEDTGKSYLIYSYGKGRNRIYISEIGVKDGKVSLLDCIEVFKGESREGNCMFKYKGRYYMCASNIYGWDGSLAYYLVADDIRGPYLPTNKMMVMNGVSADYAHVSQTGFFYVVKGSKQETVIYCGDRWANFAGNGLGYNQWCPISFEGKNPYFNSLSAWNLNIKTGEWTVGKQNNYVKNGSFEADRKRIPSSIKPVQEQLTGWHTEIVKGNKIELDSTRSPSLNYFNTTDDRKMVVGEKSLHLSDQVDFKRKVSQIITSSANIKLEDGLYKLTAKVKRSGNFSNLQLYAINQGRSLSYSIKNSSNSWQTIGIEAIPVKGGKIEIGFLADGFAFASCEIDDVVLVKIN
jgi:hypothetical protein